MSASFYLRHILWAAIVKLCGGLLRVPTLRLASKQITVLDKIIEFAKISVGLSFCVRATLRLRRLRVRPKKMRSKILACLNGRPQKVDMSRLVQNSLRVCWNATTTVLLTNSCPTAARFLRTPIKADTKSIGHILCSGEHPECHCLSLSGQ